MLHCGCWITNRNFRAYFWGPNGTLSIWRWHQAVPTLSGNSVVQRRRTKQSRPKWTGLSTLQHGARTSDNDTDANKYKVERCASKYVWVLPLQHIFTETMFEEHTCRRRTVDSECRRGFLLSSETWGVCCLRLVSRQHHLEAFFTVHVFIANLFLLQHPTQSQQQKLWGPNT